MQSYVTLMEGLNKLPVWTVHPKHLQECLEKTTAILQNQYYGYGQATHYQWCLVSPAQWHAEGQGVDDVPAEEGLDSSRICVGLFE